MRWIELSPGFACNCRCLGCFSCSADPELQMDWEEVLRWLRYGRSHGARHVWLSGGEPTLRRDFIKTVRISKKLGYERIKVQTNAMLFSYAEMVDKAVAAGMNEVNLLLKSRDPKVTDALNRLPGSHDLLQKAMPLLRAARTPAGQPLRLEGDILMTTRNYKEMPELVRSYAERDLVHFNFWLFSLADQGSRDLRRLVPSFEDVMPYMVEAKEVAESLGATVCSLNTPYCVVPPEHWSMQFDVQGMGLFVVNPGGHAFMLETSSLERGEFVETCDGCAVRQHCHGVRPDYGELFGVDFIASVSEAVALGHDPTGSILDI